MIVAEQSHTYMINTIFIFVTFIKVMTIHTLMVNYER